MGSKTPQAFFFILLASLALALLPQTNAAITALRNDANVTYFTADFIGTSYPTRTVCGRVVPVEIDHGCTVVTPINGTIPASNSLVGGSGPALAYFVSWPEALVRGCKSYQELVSQLTGILGENPQPTPTLVIFGSNLEEAIGTMKEPYGDLNFAGISSLYLVSVTKITGNLIMNDKLGPDVCVQLEKGPWVAYYATGHYQARIWIFFTWFVLIFLASLVHTGFSLKERNWLKCTVFPGLGIYSLCRLLELSIDNMNHTGKFPRVVWELLWWLGFLSAYVATCGLLYGWIHVIRRDIFSSSISKRTTKVAIILVYTSCALFFVTALISFCYESQFGVPFILYTVAYILLIPTVISTDVLFFWFGIKILTLLRSAMNPEKNTVLQKVTLMMMATVLGFLGFCSTVIVRSVAINGTVEMSVGHAMAIDILWDIFGTAVATSVVIAFALHSFKSIVTKGSSGLSSTGNAPSTPGALSKSNSHINLDETEMRSPA